MESKAENAYFAKLRVKEFDILNPCFFLVLKVSIVESDIFFIPPNPPPSEGEGVKKLEYSPSPYPLPRGERVNILKLKRNILPLDGGGMGGGEIGDFFTPSGRERVGGIDCQRI